MREPRSPRSRSLVRHGLALLAVALGLLLAAPVLAQTMTNSFGGLSKSSKDPIDIESDVLVVHDSQKYATFKGNVKAVQGTTTLRARELNVHYTGGGDKLLTGEDKKSDGVQAATATNAAGDKNGDSGTQITKIEAQGDVVITSENDQTTSSEWAIYDVPSQQVTVGGNVVLTQGKNVLKGDRLVIDLKTGESRFDNTGNTAVAGGRIRALFMPKEGVDNAKSGDATKSGDSASGEAAAGSAAPAGEAADTTQSISETSGTAASAGPTPKANKPAEDSPWQIVPGIAQ
jgi:lipopolysaccharide export system protein LptA